MPASATLAENQLAMTRVCKKCLRELPHSSFYRQKNGRDGIRTKCNKCSINEANTYTRKNVLQNKDGSHSVDQKRCHHCKETKISTEFYKLACSKDGLNPRCKKCLRQAFKANPNRIEKARIKLREWRNNNIDRARATDKAWRERNIEKSRERGREFGRKSYKKYYSEMMADPKRKARRRETARKTEKLKNGRRRAMGFGSHSWDEWVSVVAMAGNKCLKCGIIGTPESLSIDHVIPVIKGGSNFITNIQPLCFSCNSSKGAKFIDYRPWTIDSDEIGLGA